MRPSDLFAFEVWLKGREDCRAVINHRTIGKARYSFLLDLEQGTLPFHLVRGRKLGPPQTSEALEHTCTYRGRPELRAGAHVRVGGAVGRIAGAAGGANFSVIFDDDAPRYAGAMLNVHPSEIETAKEPAP